MLNGAFPAELPIGPLMRPDVCVNKIEHRDLARCGRLVERGRRVAGARPGPQRRPGRPGFAMPTSRFAYAGMNRDTGSLSRTLPSSASMRIATAATGFDIDAIRNIESGCIGRFDCEIHDALRLEIGDLAVARDECHGPGDLAGRDRALDELVHALQALARKADALRRGRFGAENESRRCDEQLRRATAKPACGSTWASPANFVRYGTACAAALAPRNRAARARSQSTAGRFCCSLISRPSRGIRA